MLTSHYRELAAPRGWRGAVRCVWEQRIGPGQGEYRQRVLPDGHADLLVTEGASVMVVGPATGASLPVLRAGSTAYGVRLVSDRARAVLGVPASELTDRVVPLAALAPGSVVRTVEDAVGGGDVRARAALDTWFAAAAPDPRVSVAVRALWRAPGLEVAAVADRVGLSSRQLRRALLAEVGLGPKTFQRIGRLHRFLALAARVAGVPGVPGGVGGGAAGGGAAGLAELAVRAGYADQPHLSREARALSGLTAAELLAHQLG